MGTEYLYQHRYADLVNGKNSKLTVMIRADLQRLITSHDQSRLSILLVLQQPHVSSTTFLPLTRFSIEPEEFGTHLEDLFLHLFIGFDFNLFRETIDRFEMDILRLFHLFILEGKSSGSASGSFALPHDLHIPLHHPWPSSSKTQTPLPVRPRAPPFSSP